jgi:hypothetical protein
MSEATDGFFSITYETALERINRALRTENEDRGGRLIRDVFAASTLLAVLFDPVITKERALEDLRRLYEQRKQAKYSTLQEGSAQ